MSAASTTTEEDSEVLRDLVAQTLEREGVLGKIKAQLRAHVYLSLEAEAGRSKAQAQANPRLAAFLGTTNGRLVASLVREFLQFFDLDFSLTVFDPETNIGRDVQYRERSRLCSALGLTELTDCQAPLLSEIMRLSKVSVLKSESPTPSSLSDSLHTSCPGSLAEDPPPPSPGSREQQPAPREIQPAPRELQPAPREQQPAPKALPPPNTKELSRPPTTTTSLTSAPSSRPSFLSDLPPLGAPRPLGDLPPLGPPPPRSLGLAPLKQTKLGAGDGAGSKQEQQEKKKTSVPNLGFEMDHVLSEKEDLSKKKGGGSEDTTPDLTENIEEELDSFLNSEISDGALDVTKDETLANSDASLKADYVESFK